jgi:hypothetical protein
MQNKTIDNALLSLRKAGGQQGKLAELIVNKEPNVRSKLSRGKFSAAYMMQCLSAVEVSDLRL